MQQSTGNPGADFTHPITAAAVTLPGFRGRTTINPVDAEHTGTQGERNRARVETTRTHN